MTDPIKDPEGIESHHLHEVAEVRGARVLEVGAGDGRLTWRYAGIASRVAAIDIDAGGLAMALHDRPAALGHTVSFVCAPSEALPFRGQCFDTVLLSWSL